MSQKEENINPVEENTAKRLLDKSLEAFSLALELYNRPTLRYHAEACSIFLCNAWELMLKSYLVKRDGIESIYYRDSDRTKSLIDCLKLVVTNKHAPLRVNMERVIEFRNTNTHFVTEDYEIIIAPFLQANVEHWAEQVEKLHEISVADILPSDKPILAIRRSDVSPEQIRARYDDPRVIQRLMEERAFAEEAENSEANAKGKIAAIYTSHVRIVKRSKDADFTVRMDRNATTPVNKFREIKDASDYYHLRPKDAIEQIRETLKKRGIQLFYRGNPTTFNRYHFNNFKKAFAMTTNKDFSWDLSLEKEPNPRYGYCQRAADTIITYLEKSPTTALDDIKTAAEKT